MSAETLLSRLHRVKSTGPDRGVAGCPVCESRNGRPVSYRLMDDGRVLLHAFCGCETRDVLRALGLRLSDLMPERLGDFKAVRKPFDALQVLQSVAHEIMVVTLIAFDLAQGSNTEQAERLTIAERRLNAALTMIGELPVPEEIRRIRSCA